MGQGASTSRPGKQFEPLDCYADYLGSGRYTQQQVRQVMELLSQHQFSNPHSINRGGIAAHEAMNEARRMLLDFMGATEEYDVVFTSGCTASLKIVADCFPFRPGSVFACTQAAHNSALGIRQVALSKGATYECSPEPPMAPTSNEKSDASDNDPVPCLYLCTYECNFSGVCYPVHKWSEEIKNGTRLQHQGRRWCVVADCAAAAGKEYVRLDGSGLDFATLSVYKMIGFPTGLGALFIKKGTMEHGLLSDKTYFGGGTVKYSVAEEPLHELRDDVASRFEDGSPNFLSLVALPIGLRTLLSQGVLGTMGDAPNAVVHPPKDGMHIVAARLESLRRKLINGLLSMKHYNGHPVIRLYAFNEHTANLSGPIEVGDGRSTAVHCGCTAAFTILDDGGTPVGHNTVEQLALVHNVQLRTGCFCNPGACSMFMGLTKEKVLRHAKMGRQCGDDMDVIEGNPTGAVRMSFGLYTTEEDVRRALRFIEVCFVVTAKEAGQRSQGSERSVSNLSGKGLFSIKRITVYPVKGCRGVNVAGASITPRGLKHDREWVVVDFNGVAVTPKRCPALSVTSVAFVSPGIMRLAHPDAAEPLYLRCDATLLSANVSLHVSGRDVVAYGCTGKKAAVIQSGKSTHGGEYGTYGSEVSAWLSTVLQLGVELLRAGQTKASTWANSGAVLVVNESTHNQLLQQMDPSERFGVTTDCYRANIVVALRGTASHGESATNYAWAENSWPSLVVANGRGDRVVLRSAGPCQRCQQVCLRKDGTYGRQPLSAIVQANRQEGSRVFGELFDVGELVLGTGSGLPMESTLGDTSGGTTAAAPVNATPNITAWVACAVAVPAAVAGVVAPYGGESGKYGRIAAAAFTVALAATTAVVLCSRGGVTEAPKAAPRHCDAFGSCDEGDTLREDGAYPIVATGNLVMPRYDE